MSKEDIIEALRETCKDYIDYGYVIEEIIDSACSDLNSDGFNRLKNSIRDTLDNYE